MYTRPPAQRRSSMSQAADDGATPQDAALIEQTARPQRRRRFIDDSGASADPNYPMMIRDVVRLLNFTSYLPDMEKRQEAEQRAINIARRFAASTNDESLIEQMRANDRLDLNRESYQKLLALAMATHARLGRESPPWLVECVGCLDVCAMIRDALIAPADTWWR